GSMCDSPTALLPRLAVAPAPVGTAARPAPPEPPAPGEWTPSDVVRNLIAVEEEVWQPRLAQLEDEDHPSWPGVEPDPWAGQPGASLDELLGTYDRARGRTMATL